MKAAPALAKGTTVWHVIEKFEGGYHFRVVSVTVVGSYVWRKDPKGFRSVINPDYPERIYPTPCYWKARDLGVRVFLTEEEAVTKAAALTDDYEKRWGWTRGIPLRRHWEENTEDE